MLKLLIEPIDKIENLSHKLFPNYLKTDAVLINNLANHEVNPLDPPVV